MKKLFLFLCLFVSSVQANTLTIKTNPWIWDSELGQFDSVHNHAEICLYNSLQTSDNFCSYFADFSAGTFTFDVPEGLYIPFIHYYGFNDFTLGTADSKFLNNIYYYVGGTSLLDKAKSYFVADAGKPVSN